MKILRLIYFLLTTIFLILITTCNDREVTNPFDANCPKELFTPSDFKAEQVGTSIKLSWKQTNTQISGFVISHNENDGTITEVTRVEKTVLSWNDSNVRGGTKYGYRLAAYAGDNQSNTLTSYLTPVYGATVTTDAVSDITSTTAVMGGNVTDEGGASVTERGVCYSTTINPITASNKVEIGSGQGAFSLAITGLTSGTNYYVRAYATNSQGTTYGTQVSFTTSFLTITPVNYIVPKESDGKIFTVASNIDWQVSSNQTWCTLSVNSGNGNSSVTATFSENTEVSQRTAELIFAGAGITNQIANITQSGTEPPALTISPENQNVTNVAGTTTFTITSNVNWTAQSDQAWCTITNNSGTGNATLTVNYEENTTNSQRIANLEITASGLSAKTVNIAQQSVLPTEGLVAYYPFNGNANDESGNTNNGTVNGATLIADRFGVANKAYSFDGGNDFINASADKLPTSERTVTLWFKANVLNGYGMLIGYGGGSCGTTWHQGISSSNFTLGVHCDLDGILSFGYQESIVGYWVQWVVTTSSSGSEIYINGESKTSNAVFINYTNVNKKDLAIGVTVNPNGIAPYTDGAVKFFNGIIDDVRIYNRTLSKEEIQALYHEGGWGN